MCGLFERQWVPPATQNCSNAFKPPQGALGRRKHRESPKGTKPNSNPLQVFMLDRHSNSNVWGGPKGGVLHLLEEAKA